MILQKSLILLVCVTTTLALSKEFKVPRKRSAEARVLHLLRSSHELMQINPTNSANCFGYYGAKLNDVLETYEKNNENCVKNALAAREAEDATATAQRNELEASSNDACAAVGNCKTGASIEDALQCYANSGSSSSKLLNSVSLDAQVNLATYQSSIQSIDSDKKICVIESKIQYEEDWNRVYGEFTDCVNGITAVPTEPPPTLEPSTISTEEPSSPSEPNSSSSEVPTDVTSSSETPTLSTEEPSSSETPPSSESSEVPSSSSEAPTDATPPSETPTISTVEPSPSQTPSSSEAPSSSSETPTETPSTTEPPSITPEVSSTSDAPSSSETSEPTEDPTSSSEASSSPDAPLTSTEASSSSEPSITTEAPAVSESSTLSVVTTTESNSSETPFPETSSVEPSSSSVSPSTSEQTSTYTTEAGERLPEEDLFFRFRRIHKLHNKKKFSQPHDRSKLN